ncbi:hypothetical protein, partial [Rhodococcus pyridinivorans]|uniref:hypothetical protein n=1 Tax=Rhodococcus pyridinivorans TaxID=103816 RepID=UPI0039B67C62
MKNVGVHESSLSSGAQRRGRRQHDWTTAEPRSGSRAGSAATRPFPGAERRGERRGARAALLPQLIAAAVERDPSATAVVE